MTGTDHITFYDWDTFSIVRRIETVPKNVYWSESGTFLILQLESEFYLMKYNEAETKRLIGSPNIPEEGIDGSFTCIG